MSFDSDNTETQHLAVAVDNCELIVRAATNHCDVSRKEFVRNRLIQLRAHDSSCQFEKATLLQEVQEFELWKTGFRSFKEYVETVVEMKVRTVHEMLRVLRTCKKHGISADEILQFGWSKVAVVASRMNAENIGQCRVDLAALSFSQLRKQYGGSPRTKTMEPKEDTELVITECIVEAMQHAAAETSSTDDQLNLEHVALRFLAMARAQRQLTLIANNN